MFDGETILITGGTGSFGKSFSEFLLENFNLKKLIVFSRDELKQFHMQEELRDERVRFFIGDVRDLQRLERAFDGVDVVVHAAALKQVPTSEYNPFEAVKTNILGSQNVIDAAINKKVKKVLLISTDKAVQPVNLYGSTKLCAEKLFISGNSYTHGETKLSCVRYGNVIGSRGSIIETLSKNKDLKKVQITHLEMTRFWITLKQTFDLVLYALQNMEGGEIFVPQVPSMKLVDLFDALVPGVEKEVVGIRPGEKLHEVLLTEQESEHAVETEKYYVILPTFFTNKNLDKHKAKGKEVKKGFRYTSDTNGSWLDKNELLKLINDSSL
jgi:UDP-N-acetylglucosamine 4,6-dehydratase